MFEYTALVDAPVKRFTSIVTDPEPDEGPITPMAATPSATTPIVVAEATDVATAVEPEPLEPTHAPSLAVAPMPPLAPAARTAPRVALREAVVRPVARPLMLRDEHEPTAFASVPTLIGIAAAAVTAFLWLRRDSHDR